MNRELLKRFESEQMWMRELTDLVSIVKEL